MPWTNQGGGPWGSGTKGPWGSGSPPSGSSPPDLEELLRQSSTAAAGLIDQVAAARDQARRDELLSERLNTANHHISELKAALTQRSNDADHLKIRFTAAHDRASRLETAARRLSGERDLANANLGELEKAVRDERAANLERINNLAVALDARSSEVGLLSGRLNASDDHASKLEAALEQRSSEVGNLQVRLSASHEQVDRLEAALELRSSEVSHSNDELTASQEQIGKLQASLESLTGEIQAVRGRADSVTDALCAQVANTAALQSRLAAFERRCV